MEEKQVIRKAGLKVTLPRMKILEDSRDPRAEPVAPHDRRGRLQGTAGAGRGYRVGHELNRGEHHDHIVCLDCGKVEEFVDKTIEGCQEKIASKHGFRIRDHSLIIYGECLDPNCPERNKK